MNSITNVETERLILVPSTEKDGAFIFELFNSPKWIAYIGDRNITSIDDAKRYLKEKIIPQYQKSGFGTFTVIRKSDTSKIGTCGLYDREGIDGIDLGFAFLPEFEKKGYAFESAKELIAIAFEKFNLKSIKAITTKQNSSSRKLLAKLWFIQKGKMELLIDGKQMLLYEKTKDV